MKKRERNVFSNSQNLIYW